MRRSLLKREWLHEAAVLAGFVLLAVLMTWPLAANLGSHVIKAKWYYDSMVNLHILGSRMHYLLGLSDSLKSVYDNYFCAPVPYSIANNESHFGLGLLFLPFYVITRDPLLSYNLLLIVCMGMSGFFAYLFVRALTGNQLAALLAGVGYGFCPFLFFELGRIQLVAAQWIPLFALLLHRTFSSASWGSVIGLGLTFAMQVGTCLYYAMFLIVYAAIVSPFLLFRWRPAARLLLPRLAVSAVLTGALVAGMVYPYFAARRDFGLVRSAELTSRYAGKLSYLAKVFPENKGLPFLHDPAQGPEEPIAFPGFTLLVLAALALLVPLFTAHRRWPPGTLPLRLLGVALALVAIAGGLALSFVFNDLAAVLLAAVPCYLLWRKLRKAPLLPELTGLYAALLLAGLALFLGPIAFRATGTAVIGPYHYLYHYVPGFDGIRYASRFAILGMLALTLLAGQGAAYVLRGSLVQRALGFGVLLACMLFELRNAPMTLAKLPGRSDLPDVYRWLEKHGGPEPIATMPAYTMGYFGARNDYLALFHRRRTVDGKSSWMQPITYAYIFESRRFPRNSGARMLQMLGVKYLVLHTEEYDPERAVRVLQWVDNRPDTFKRRYSSGTHYVYEVLPTDDSSVRLMRTPKLPPGAVKIPQSELTGRANMAYDLAAPFDGDPQTRWRTRHNQQAGNWFEIVLNRERRIAALELGGFDDAFEAPAAYKLSIAAASGDYQTVVSQPLLRFYRDQVYHPRSFVMRIVLPEPVLTTAVRIQLTDGVAGHEWTIGEANLYAVD